MVISLDEIEAASSPQAPEPPKTKRKPVVLIAAALAACAAAGTGVYLIAPQFLDTDQGNEGSQNAASLDHAEGGRKNDSHSEKKGDGSHGNKASLDRQTAHIDDGAFTLAGDIAYFTPEPMVVSIRPVGRVRHLKIAYAVETTASSEGLFRANDLRIKDVLTTYLRSLDIATIEDPAAMDRIRAQIQKRISLVVSPAPVTTILITDFIIS